MLSKVSTFLGPNGFFATGGTPSLVLSLDAAGYTGSGTWSDLTNFNNDATSDGPISWSSEGGGSFEFDGSSAYFSFATVSGIPVGNSQYTMEAWFKSDSFEPSEQGTLVGWGNSGENYKSNVLRLNANGLTNYWWGDDISVSFTGTSSMNINNWYYAASTYDGTTRNLYLNGNLVQSGTPSAPLEVDNIQSLKVGYSYTNYFNGKISKVKVHTKALSSAKILSNFNADKVRHGAIFGSMTFSSADKSYLISNSNDYIFATNDFTIEAFVKLQLSTELYGGIVSLRPNGQSYISINTVDTNTSTPLIEFFADGVAYNFTASNDMWYHTAISRVGGTTSFYVNGELFNEITDAGTYSAVSDVVVGRYFTDSDDYYTQGLISNVRIINGTGLYSGPSITIPDTPLQPITNTKLLIISQQTSPTLDVSGNFQSITASNIGWTSSLPEFIVSQGLEFFVDATDIVSNPSNSSSNWIDISGNGRNLTFSGPTFYTLCLPGCANSLMFNSNQTAQTSPVTISYPTGYTIESVVCFSNLSNGDGIFEFDESSSGKYINVQRESNGTIRFEVNQGNQLLSVSTTTNNLWYHITCVYNSSTQLAKIYINGVEDASGTYSSTTSTTAPIILGLHDTYLDGNISLTRFYSIPLTPTQVLINFNYTKSVYGL